MVSDRYDSNASASDSSDEGDDSEDESSKKKKPKKVVKEKKERKERKPRKEVRGKLTEVRLLKNFFAPTSLLTKHLILMDVNRRSRRMLAALRGP